MNIGYFAMFNFDECGKIPYGIAITFPNLPTAYTCADSIENGKKFAKEVLELAPKLC